MTRLTTILYVGTVTLLIAAVIGLVLILTNLNPLANPSNAYILYVDVFLLILSISFIIGFFLRRRFGLREQLTSQIAVSLRQSVLFGVITVASLILLSFGLFNWINGSLLVLSVVFLEAYFLFK